MSVDGSKSVCCPSCREYSNGKMTEKGRNQHSLGGVSAVADPDLQVRGRGSQKNFFQPFEHQFGLKIRGALPRIHHCSIKGELTVLAQGE